MSFGEGTEIYDQLMKLGIAKIVGFEPVKEECEKLNKKSNGTCTYLPYVIGDGGSSTFNECNFPMTSSVYEPNTPLLDKFQNLTSLMQVVKKEKVQTRRLDDIPEVKDADYLKVDVQGGELGVFSGSEELLKHVVIVETEVEFVPLYKDQPLFAEVDQMLRRHGFIFHKFIKIQGRTFKPLLIRENVNATMSQVLWGDAIYVKDFMNLGALSPEKLLKLVIVLHEVYRSYDLCAAVLVHYDNSVKGDLSKRYINKLLNTRPEQNEV